MSEFNSAQERAFALIRDIHKQRKIVQEILKGDTVSAFSKLSSFILDELEERQQLQDELLRSEQKYKNLLESGMDAVTVVNDGKFLFVNNSFTEMLGYNDSSELVGRDFMLFVNDMVKDLLRYEYALHRFLDFPFEALCAYNIKTIVDTGYTEVIMPLVKAHGKALFLAQGGSVILEPENTEDKDIEKLLDIKI